MLRINETEWNEHREAFRLAVLDAMDEAMAPILKKLGRPDPRQAFAWTDADLPELFRALDAQFIRACKYHDVQPVGHD